MSKTTIEWTMDTWNPTTGCDKVSAGCKYCYAEIMARRLMTMGQEKYADGFEFRIHESALNIPFAWKKPRLVFVNSMSDLFHHEMPVPFLKEVFGVMAETPKHIYQVLTKRSERLKELSHDLNFTDNIWMGVSVENDKVLRRIDDLRATKAKVKFLSIEPLLGPLPDLNLEGIDWVIVGGESHRSKPRSIKEEWVEEIRLASATAGVPFFFKQWGGKNKKKAGRLLNGRTYEEMPQQYYDWLEENEGGCGISFKNQTVRQDAG